VLELYQRIWRNTWRTQVVLIILSVSVGAVASLPLHYQKTIINGLASGLDRQHLLLLGAQFLGVLVLSAALKFVLGYRMSILGEATIRLIRKVIFSREVNTTRPKSEIQQGTLASMVAAEAEEVGRFAGGAIASPLMQIGILVSVITYIASNQPTLGIFVLAVVLPQAGIVLTIQKQINTRVAQRVKLLRRATNGVVAEDIKRVEQAVLNDFDEIYEARRKIFLFKLSAKFVLNAINGLGTAGVLVLGGWLVLSGKSDIGIVVAALTGLARISQPWRELIAFYRELSTVRVKYQLLLLALP
jgi:ABC-type bacteriocin/lantibiotic exporter with double-glycine peptidase domain